MLALSVIFTAFRLWAVLPISTFSNIVYVTLVSGAYAFILPGQVAAEGMRVYMLGRNEKSYNKPSAAIIVNKVLGLIVLLLLGILGLTVTGRLTTSIMGLVFLITTAGLCLFLPSIHIPFVYKFICAVITLIEARFPKVEKVCGYIIRTTDNMRNYTRQKGIVAKNLLFCLLFHLSHTAMVAAFTFSIGHGFMYFDWLWIHALVTFAFMLPITFGNAGVRELSFIAFLSMVGLYPEQALAVSFGYLTLQLFVIVIGFALEILVKIRKGNMK